VDVVATRFSVVVAATSIEAATVSESRSADQAGRDEDR
jgi:hypothetical protein